MDHYKISKLLNNSTVSKFLIRKLIQVNDLLNGKYSTIKNIGFKTPTLRSDLCDFRDAYIVVKGIILLSRYLDPAIIMPMFHL